MKADLRLSLASGFTFNRTVRRMRDKLEKNSDKHL